MKIIEPEYQETPPSHEQIKALKGKVLLEFGAPWCGHCQAAQPAISEVLEQLPMTYIKVFDGKGKKLGRIFGVKLWPTFILLNNGEEIARLIRPTQRKEVNDLLSDSMNQK